MAKKKRKQATRGSSGEAPRDLPDRRREPGLSPLDQAQALLAKASHATASTQVRLARQALEISRDCADAYALLAEHADSLEDASRLYQEAVAAGERALGGKFDEYRGKFWGVPQTRPYMRAREGLASCLWDIGRREEAAEHAEEMLRLDPRDHQGIRYLLVAWLTELDRDEALRRLLDQYRKDASAYWTYAAALAAFRKEGDTPRSRKALDAAVRSNEYVVDYLLGHREIPRQLPRYIASGEESEAVHYVSRCRAGWLDTPGAVTWLRKILGRPLPDAPKARKPAWPQLRQALLRIPQEEEEQWEVHVEEFVSDEDEESGPLYAPIVAACAGDEVLGLEHGDVGNTLQEAWAGLLELMRRPEQWEPHRPGTIRLQDQRLFKAWRGKLKQLHIDCELCDRLEHVGELMDAVDRSAFRGPDSVPLSPEELQPASLLDYPQEPGEAWQADVRLVPAWITGEREPYRPWGVMVASRADETVLVNNVTPEWPHGEGMWEAIVQAVRRPAIGEPHRPATLELIAREELADLEAKLRQAGIEPVIREQLELVDYLFDDLSKHLAGRDAPAGMIDVPGMTLKQLAGFFDAAAEFYRAKPWGRVAGDTPITIHCDRFQSGPWHAVVMGQSGVTQGVALYEDLEALRQIITGNASDEENIRQTTALSLMFSEAFEISVRDLDAAERHGWTVAGPEAYPLVLHVNPGGTARPPLAWELQLLEAVARAIPRFLRRSAPELTLDVPTAGGDLPLRLSWAAMEP